ncbi:hypothetical protein Mapa_014674 [Marchantia paleacea]|nr:hypothetical protein Mapa_014674 [Marchantia paleacea]
MRRFHKIFTIMILTGFAKDVGRVSESGNMCDEVSMVRVRLFNFVLPPPNHNLFEPPPMYPKSPVFGIATLAIVYIFPPCTALVKSDVPCSFLCRQ